MVNLRHSQYLNSLDIKNTPDAFLYSKAHKMIHYKHSVEPTWFEIIGSGISLIVFFVSLYGLLYLI